MLNNQSTILGLVLVSFAELSEEEFAMVTFHTTGAKLFLYKHVGASSASMSRDKQSNFSYDH